MKNIPIIMIHIACNIDHNYVRHCAVTLVSLFENNKEENIAVHIIARDLTDNDKKILDELCRKYHNTIHYYAPDEEMLKGFTIRKFSKRISMATYYRCILSALLPTTIDKVLYLDCDIVVLGSIVPLWNTPLEGKGVAAVEDIGCHETQRYDILKYPMEYSYFNAGVLLINLAYWREHDVAHACVEYFHKYPERILFNDQDLLNSILCKNKVLIAPRWNAQDGFYRNTENCRVWREDFADDLLSPVILHYTNRKPWEYDSQHPMRNEYAKYLDLTPWKGQYPWKSPASRLKRFFRLLPFNLSLRQPKYIDLHSLKTK